MSDAAPGPAFSAHHVVEYTYRRSVGPVLGRFFTELRERRIVGIRRADGTVLVPPAEYDPDSGEALDEIVSVGPTGVVASWAWVRQPSAKHPLERPFAWALIRLDGADSSLLHAVDAGHESAMSTGMRVRPRWREATRGEIHDIECFEPEGAS
ncbi:MAG: OB-fold domain-containing protein [Myxococcales bacterium]|nr:OB-fold domain-containing protein [Myxococcales bacterium]